MWHARSGLPLRRCSKTTGMKYQGFGIKTKLGAGVTDAEANELLTIDGMIVKRLFVVIGDVHL